MKSLFCILFIVIAGTAHAHYIPGPVRVGDMDSLLPVHAIRSAAMEDDLLSSDLQNIENDYHTSGNHRQAMAHLLQMVRSRLPRWNKKIKYRLLNDLAGVSARLRLYPIAMECYYSAGHEIEDSSFYQQLSSLDTSSLWLFSPATPKELPITKVSDILSAFEDGKEAAAYAMLVHVKQPAPGRRRAFSHINNVGHTFITLIKYNKDNSYVSRSFGFYPHKNSPIAATPLHPRSPAVFRDDALHDWDELAGKFISYRKFRKIAAVLLSYDQKYYHLCHNNCTDFGLTLAELGGISIRETVGHWPLGKGNNPGSAGQSMLEGKISNTDLEDPVPLFVNNKENFR